MQTNPVMERIIRLSEQWKSLLTDSPDMRVICWRGSSLTDYKMIKGFVMFHMSEESTLDDLFILCGQSFCRVNSPKYGELTGDSINQYIESWNNDTVIVAEHGKLCWTFEHGLKFVDIENFVENMNILADYLIPGSEESLLVIAFFPSEIRDFELYCDWVRTVLSTPISDKIRIMLYDSSDALLFKELAKEFPERFCYLIPDIDMGGAIHEVLENAKQERSSQQDKDAITFQQHLVRLTESLAKGDEKAMCKHAEVALLIAQGHEWAYLEAVVYYFVHGLYSSQKNYKKAEDYINLAISRVEKSLKDDGDEHLMSYCEYLASKAMLFLIQEKYDRAIPVYAAALQVASLLENTALKIGIHQMKGICHRQSDEHEDAWDDFVFGWDLIDPQGEEVIRPQLHYKYYACEMMKVRKNTDIKWKYECLFRSLWGREWEEELLSEQKENKQKYKIFKG